MIFTQKSMTKHRKFYQQPDPGKLGALRGQTGAAFPGMWVLPSLQTLSEKEEWTRMGATWVCTAAVPEAPEDKLGIRAGTEHGVCAILHPHPMDVETDSQRGEDTHYIS